MDNTRDAKLLLAWSAALNHERISFERFCERERVKAACEPSASASSALHRQSRPAA
jgi:hypothetical protein